MNDSDPGPTYVAQWPVHDEDATLATLTAIAWPDAIRMMLRDGVRPAGEPEWSTFEHGGQLFLNARIPAEENDAYQEVA